MRRKRYRRLASHPKELLEIFARLVGCQPRRVWSDEYLTLLLVPFLQNRYHVLLKRWPNIFPDSPLETAGNGNIMNYFCKTPGSLAELETLSREEYPRAVKAARSRSPRRRKRIEQLAENLGLTHAEVRLIDFLDLTQHSVLIDDLRLTTEFSAVDFISRGIGRPASEVSRALSPRGMLRMLEIVQCRRIDEPPRLDAEVVEWIAGTGERTFGESFFRKDNRRVLRLESFTIPDKERDIIQALLEANGSCNILLYGEPGTGKTEFARSVSRTSGRPTYFVMQGDQGSMKERKMAVMMARQMARDRGIIIVDEADDLLDSAGNKAWINAVLDSGESRIIWIVNRYTTLEPWIRRRFEFSLKFNPFGRKERENIWNNVLRRTRVRQALGADFVRGASLQFPVNAAGIASAVRSAERILPLSSLDAPQLVCAFLEKHANLVQGKSIERPAAAAHYSLEALHADVDLESVIMSVSSFHQKSLKSKPAAPLNLLFWGQPGTGKTEFARFLAHALEIEIIEKRASDLLGPFVGMTEGLIRRAFEEASSKGALLLFDEADSLLSNRAGARESWERSFTNEFLASLERFNGLFAATTNMLDMLDPASLRRFAWKIEFKPLRAESRVQLFHSYFPEVRLTPEDETELRAMPRLTPGDFKAALLRHSHTDSATAAQILNSLRGETQYRAVREIGFRS